MAFGWYSTLLGGVVVGTLSVPAAPKRDCTAIFSCVSPFQGLIIAGIFFGAPVFVGLLISTLLITGPIARRVRSAILAGTLSAVASLCVVGAVAAAYLARR